MKLLRKVGLVALVVVAAQASWAKGFLDWIQPYQGPGQDVVTLVITANYAHPRVLADLIQNESRQPYILVPARQDVDQEMLYFCPVNNKKPALQVKKSDFKRFVQLVNPKRVVILGDDAYVPTQYEKDIDPSIPVIVIRGDDWKRAAAGLSELLNLSNLKSDYAKLSTKIDEKLLYKPEVIPGAPAQVVTPPVAVAPVEGEVIEVDVETPIEGSVDVENTAPTPPVAPVAPAAK